VAEVSRGFSELVEAKANGEQMQGEMQLSRNAFYVAVLITLPFVTAIEILLYGLGINAMLQLTGHTGSTFKPCIKIVAYSFAARITLAIPVLGHILSSVYAIALLIIGVRYHLRAPLLKTAIAVILPVLLFSSLGLFAIG